MATEQIIALLIQERDKLNRAIEALGAPVRRRGRPPKNPVAIHELVSVASAPKRGWSAAQRKAASARMKARWAKRKKEAGK
jgi:hypothetical protein